jgi:hypothetical protein
MEGIGHRSLAQDATLEGTVSICLLEGIGTLLRLSVTMLEGINRSIAGSGSWITTDRLSLMALRSMECVGAIIVDRLRGSVDRCSGRSEQSLSLARSGRSERPIIEISLVAAVGSKDYTQRSKEINYNLCRIMSYS